MVCLNCILGRTGTQEYLEREILNDSNSDKVVKVNRPAQEVFSEKTIASFENKPLTIEHPHDFVDSENYKDLSVGFVRDVRKMNVDGHDLLVGNIIITDKHAINLVKDGKKFLSCGYDCDIVQDKNGQYQQQNIRGNHVALCNNPRGGITKIVDHDSFFYKNYKVDIKNNVLNVYKNNEFLYRAKSIHDSKQFINKDIKTVLVDSLDVVIKHVEKLHLNDKQFYNKLNKIIIMLSQIKENTGE